MIYEAIEKIKIVALHKDSKVNHLHEAYQLAKLLQPNIDFEYKDQLELYIHILKTRIQNSETSQSLILLNIAKEKPDILEIAKGINQNSYDFELITKEIRTLYNQTLFDLTLETFKTKLSKIEVTDYPDFLQRFQDVKDLFSQTYEKLVTMELNDDENEFIIDENTDIETQIKDEAEHLKIHIPLTKLSQALQGFQSSRVYIFAAGTGQGKSLLLNNLTFYTANGYKESDYRLLFENEFHAYKPTIYFFTNENTIAETRARLVSIITNKPTTAPELKQKSYVAKVLQEFCKACDVSIIIKYIPPRSATAYDLLSYITNKEKVYGYKPICVIVDYLDRLKSVQKTDVERFLLGYVTDELKYLSIKLNVPVITATQLNRSGHQENSPSIIHIDESWKKVQNADAVIVFNSIRIGEKREFEVTIGKLRYAEIPSEPIKLIQEGSSLRVIEQTTNQIGYIFGNNSTSFIQSQNTPLSDILT